MPSLRVQLRTLIIIVAAVAALTGLIRAVPVAVIAVPLFVFFFAPPYLAAFFAASYGRPRDTPMSCGIALAAFVLFTLIWAPIAQNCTAYLARKLALRGLTHIFF